MGKCFGPKLIYVRYVSKQKYTVCKKTPVKYQVWTENIQSTKIYGPNVENITENKRSFGVKYTVPKNQ